MAHPLTLCVDITGTQFTALLLLQYGGGERPPAGNDAQLPPESELNHYTMTASGTVGGSAVMMVPTDPGCGPEQSWTCLISSADVAVANYTLQGGEEGTPRTGTISTGACGIPELPTCDLGDLGDPGDPAK